MRTSKCLWDIIHFLASFCLSCIINFKGVLLNLIQPDWMLVYSPKVTVWEGYIFLYLSTWERACGTAWFYGFLNLEVLTFVVYFLLGGALILLCSYSYLP